MTLQELKKARLRVASLVVADAAFAPVFKVLNDAVNDHEEDVQAMARALLERTAA